MIAIMLYFYCIDISTTIFSNQQTFVLSRIVKLVLFFYKATFSLLFRLEILPVQFLCCTRYIQLSSHAMFRYIEELLLHLVPADLKLHYMMSRHNLLLCS